MNNFERRVELLESLRRRDRTMSESIGTPSSDENVDVVDTDEPSKGTPVSSGMDVSEGDPVPNQDENSNFAGDEELDLTTNVLNHVSPAETLSPTEIISTDTDVISLGNRDFNQKDNASDEETTAKEYSHTDTRNVRLPQESLPLNYIYKRNNERSNLQDFLRDEAMKDIRAIITERTPSATTALDARLNNILRVDELTGKIIGAINRPKSLAIEKVDNMTAAQANKLKVLLQEYGMTPNNNEFSTILEDPARTANRTNMNDNNRVLLDVADERNAVSSGENANNNALPTLDVKLPGRTATGGLANNYERLHGIDAIDKPQESVLNNASQQNVADTPMSCTTDNFTTLSTHTPLSQAPNCDDLFSLNIGPETSCLSSNTVRSVAEETCFGSPVGDFKLPNLFSPDAVRPNIAPSSLTIADVEMIDHTSLQVYLEKSIIIPLQIQSRLINNAIIKYLLNEHNMLLHLHSLRSYFFLLNGEFAKSLTDALYSRLYAISAPIELFNSATLTNLLEQALMNSFSNNYVNSELLSLSAVDKPCQLYVSVTLTPFQMFSEC